MKANELKKESISIEDIYKSISDMSAFKHYKHFIPHHIYVSEQVKLQLIEDGFKVYKSDWDGVIKDCLIIEW